MVNRNLSQTAASNSFLTVFGIWIGGLLALFQLDLWWLWNAVVILWLTATLGAFVLLQDGARRKAITGWLDTPTYGSLYLRLVTPVASLPRDWRCYDWALRLAVVYPILSMVLLWAMTGRAGTIGTIEFLPAHDSWATTVATLGAIAIAVSGPMLQIMAAASPKIAVRRVSGWLPLATAAFGVAAAFAGAGAGAVTAAFAGEGEGEGVFAVAVAVTFAFAVTAKIAGKGAFAGAAAAAVAVAFAVAFAVAAASVAASAFAGASASVAAGAFASVVAGAATVAGATAALFAGAAAAAGIERLAGSGRGTLGYVLLTAVLVLALVGTLIFPPWTNTNDSARSLFLIFGLLPLVNALTDYASYAITIALVRRGLNTAGWAIAMGLLDIVAAFGLFTVLGAALVLVVAGANALAGVALFPLAPLFAGLRADPVDYLWLYAMLFSTLVPTLVHLVFAVFSMAALPFFALIDVPLSRWINQPDHATAVAARISLGLAATVSVLLPVLMAYVLYLGAAQFWPDIAQGYLGMFETLSRIAGEA